MTSQEIDYLNPEQKLIEEIQSMVGNKFIGDDCARLPGGLLVSSDSLIEGTHFRLETISLYDLGWRAMVVNLSDIAAMAGQPHYALVNLALPKKLNKNQFLKLYSGISDCAKQYRTAIVGGDTTASENLMISITVIGYEHKNGCLMRSQACAGDIVVVTGSFGANAAERYLLKPTPRIKEAQEFVEYTGARAALMDASDGLADALAQIVRASNKNNINNIGMDIDLKEIPIDSKTRQLAEKRCIDPIDLALYGGEDYELVGCLPEKVWQAWQNEKLSEKSPEKLVKIPFKKIGTVNNSGKIRLMLNNLDNKEGPKLDLTKCFQHNIDD